MQNATIKASVHRFRDMVSLYVGNGQTVYIDPNDAAMLAKALDECRADVINVPKFSHSQFVGKSFEFEGYEG